MLRIFSFLRSRMKDSDKYDVNKAPVSGPFAGLDPAQPPVIVDKQGERVQDVELGQRTDAAIARALGNDPDSQLVDLLVTLCMTHTVQIETAPGAPVHRIVMGSGPDIRPLLADALKAAVKHHNDPK
jgi:hypothetical protein